MSEKTTAEFIGGSIEVTMRTKEAAAAVYDAVLEALRETFHGSILPEAKALSPVGTEEHGNTSGIHNADSLKVDVFGTKKGPFAKMYSTSGHGGYIELGTIHMSGHPYMWPAFQTNLGKLLLAIKLHVSEIKIEGGVALGRVTQ